MKREIKNYTLYRVRRLWFNKCLNYIQQVIIVRDKWQNCLTREVIGRLKAMNGHRKQSWEY